MDFELSDEHRLMEDTAEKFGQKDVVEWMDRDGDIREMVPVMGELGLFGCVFPPRYGGIQAGFLAHSVVCEKISTYDSGLRALFNLQALTVPYTMMEWATDAAKDKYIKPLVTGEKIGCTCFSEPNAGSDLSAMETKIEDKGDHFLINGNKTWISNGSLADYAIVYGSYDRNLKHKGICAVIVDTHQAGWHAKEIGQLGDKKSPIAEILLDNVTAPKENLLGDWGGRFQGRHDRLGPRKDQRLKRCAGCLPGLLERLHKIRQ